MKNNETKYKVQTCNGNPEVIKVVNGIAREIVVGDKFKLTNEKAQSIAEDLNNLDAGLDYLERLHP